MKEVKPFQEYLEGEYEKSNKSYSLYEVIQTVSTIECVDCGVEDSSDEDAGDAMETFYANGWRMKGREEPICKKCRLKMNRIAKKNGK